MILPIAGCNPMASQSYIYVIYRLINMGAEEIMSSVVHEISSEKKNTDSIIGVAINLIDDVKGA